MTKWQAPTQNASSASLVWLISFGDLLTLLVCFFLVLTPWHSSRTDSEQEKLFNSAGLDRHSLPGTDFANSSVGPQVGVIREVPIDRGQFGDGTRTELFTANVIAALRSAESVHAMIRVRVCGGGSSEETIRSVLALVATHKQASQKVSIELLGECEQVEVLYPTSAPVVGSVRLVRE